MSRLLHDLMIDPDPAEILGPTILCTEHGPFITGVRLVGGDGDGLRAEHAGVNYLLSVCDGCLESLIRRLLPAGGVDL